MRKIKNQLKVADEVWLATALLHQRFDREGFDKKDILASAQHLHPDEPCRPGVSTHVSQHCVADIAPNPGRYRMLHRNEDGTYRLYREGDPSHPGRRNGKSVPEQRELPEEYRGLIDWYRDVYNKPRSNETADPLMKLKGLGKKVWKDLGGGDAVIQWLRSDEPTTPPWERDATRDVRRTA